MKVKHLNTESSNFETQFAQLLTRETPIVQGIEAAVKDIIADVIKTGDQALFKYTQRFDDFKPVAFRVDKQTLVGAEKQVSNDLRHSMAQAIERVTAFHQAQKLEDWHFVDEIGVHVGQKITPIDRVGVYVPGGKAAYPSSVIMNAIPATVAGVKHICMMTPTPKGELNEAVLTAASLCGVDEIYTIGGAQAIAALAYGTESIAKVDKIVGPGNAYVAEAKRQVFGQVGIDMIAGPSEITIITDGQLPVEWAAMDLFSQAEHDELSQAILLCHDGDYLLELEQTMHRLIETMPRKSIIETAITHRSALIQTKDLAESIALANRIAPEHLELAIEQPEAQLEYIQNAGAIFLGIFTPEVFGDYCAGPNHILPTSATARFSSPLGVPDFQKRSSVVQCNQASAQKLARTSITLAEHESLTAHATAARYRLK